MSKRDFYYSFLLIFYLFFTQTKGQINQLAVFNGLASSSKNGYIDNPVLVIEPHGGYVEQSLYLYYSDHNQFPGSQNLEVVHRFGLPQGSTINDLWLWIGKNVMKAVMMDTWSARHIYDSIVVNKRDPAFLAKKGNQYELHVYPLTSGSSRKIKLTFITPAIWKDGIPGVELPLKLLKAGMTANKPVEILFRQKSTVWNTPSITQSNQAAFSHFLDSAGYSYFHCSLNNLTNYNELNLQFNTDLSSGIFFSGISNSKDTSYFQIGIDPVKFFNVPKDSLARKILFAVDLSGTQNKILSTLVPNLKTTIKASLKSGDLYNIVIAGAGKIKYLFDNWLIFTPSNVDAALSNFASSAFADSIVSNSKHNIVFCDRDGSAGWKYSTLPQMANVKEYSTIIDASNYFASADIVTAYRHGFDDAISESAMYGIATQLDSLFLKGGRFLTYFDKNRNEGDKLIHHYFNGISAVTYSAYSVTLKRNIYGNIGYAFPDEMTHNFVYTLNYNDPDVKVEVTNDKGEPVIISKKIKNGLMVVSAIWQLRDDETTKTLLSAPLLGMTLPAKQLMLNKLLTEVQRKFNGSAFDKLILFTNSDSLYTINQAESFTPQYLAGFMSFKPAISAVNLLDGSFVQPPNVNYGGVSYYASGYLLKQLADLTGGQSFETSTSGWTDIQTSLSPSSMPQIEDLGLSVKVDDDIAKTYTVKEINKNRADTKKLIFIVGSSSGKNKVNFRFNTKFLTQTQPIVKSAEFLFPQDSTYFEKIIPSVLAVEDLKDYFSQTKYDTTKIIKLATKYNLLCDYTALIALEPNEKYHFVKNPLDESGFIYTGIENFTGSKDTTFMNAYPNPFNSSTVIRFYSKKLVKANIYIYNILGQLVYRLADSDIVQGDKRYVWNGKNSNNQLISSGIYFAVAEVKGLTDNSHKIVSQKLLLLK